MAEINIKKYVKVDGKWKFVAIPKLNGKMRMTHILVKGEPVRSLTGTFYLDWRQNGKRHQQPVGTDPRMALEAYRDQADRMAKGKPVAFAERPLKESKGITIEDACSAYLRDVKATKSLATYRDYRPSLAWFLEETEKEYVEDLDRGDIMALFELGREMGFEQKTINKKVTTIRNAMVRAGAKIELFKGDWPALTIQQVEKYERTELVTFFAHCAPRERLLFQTFLCTGFRHMEVATLSWQDINWVDGTLAVTAKPDLGFKPKNHEERSVPVPRSLVESLQALRKANPHVRLVFPTVAHPTRKDIGGEGVDGKMLETCKEIALKARLNCGMCADSKLGHCKNSPTCSRWYLHKFRHTFATNMLQSNVDIKTLQVLMGHKRIGTTERYLRSLLANDLRDKVEASTLAALL